MPSTPTQGPMQPEVISDRRQASGATSYIEQTTAALRQRRIGTAKKNQQLGTEGKLKEAQHRHSDSDDDATSRTSTNSIDPEELLTTPSDDGPSEAKEMNLVECFEGVKCGEVLSYFLASGVLPKLVTTAEPWVLVPSGSFMGKCDWVPERFRMGPWHMASRLYLAALTVLVFYECWTCPASTQQLNTYYHDQGTAQWYYNVVGALWTSYVIVEILKTNMGWTSWGMYTVWSWTFIAARHILSALAPLAASSTSGNCDWVLIINERLRFPVLVMSTLTFTIWNLCVGPSIYMQMKTDSMKASFNRFFGSFHYKQMHVFNLAWAVVSGIYGSPKRELEKADFCLALALCLLYAYFYLCVLDRLGVHYYLVFSPRTPWALLSWSILFGAYYGLFPMWKDFVLRYA